jgi:hypothetical protein
LNLGIQRKRLTTNCLSHDTASKITIAARVLKTFPPPQKINFFFSAKAKWIMLFMEMTAVFSENHNKYTP